MCTSEADKRDQYSQYLFISTTIIIYSRFLILLNSHHSSIAQGLVCFSLHVSRINLKTSTYQANWKHILYYTHYTN